MKWSAFSTARAACAYFFICPGLLYGLFTARLPALKEQTGADEAQIGLVLLCFGVSGLVSLCASARFIALWGSRRVLRAGSLILLAALPLCGLAPSALWLALSCVLVGCGTGLVDVAMNTQAIQIELRHRASCMALMHAAYSLGGVMGSLAGALFAACGFSPLVNFVGVLGLYALIRPLAVPHLQADSAVEQNTQKSSLRALPPFVVGCGLLALCTYATEGSVAEWGSLLLFSVKGADEQTAALVFGAFAGATVLCRLFVDRMRSFIGDFPLICGGALIATGGMALALFSPQASVCLLGYACMGAGLSPIVPTLFSRAGAHPGVTPGEASAAVSVLAYGGLLFFPPLLGWLAHRVGLDNALLVVLGLCGCLVVGSVLLRGKRNLLAP